MPAHDENDDWDEATAEDSFDEAQLPDTYPRLKPKGKGARDWDSALLADCSARRIRIIAKAYPGIPAKWKNKLEHFQLICDAMADDMECLQCKGGDCDPFTHYFAPTEPPPAGWVRGQDGLYRDPSKRPEPEKHPQPESTQQPGASTRQSAPPSSIASLDLATSNFRHQNPVQTLLRPTGSADIHSDHGGTPYIAGVSQVANPPPNVAQLVVNGGKTIAAASDKSNPSSHITDEFVSQADFEAQVEAELQREAEAAAMRRQKEAQEAENRQSMAQQAEQQKREYLERRKASFKAAQEAEERAHKLRLEQINSAAQAASFRPSNPTPPHAAGFLPPAVGLRPRLQTLPTYTDPHRPRSVSFSDPVYSHVEPQTLSQPGMVSLEAVEALIEQRLRSLGQSSNLPSCNAHGSSPNLSADHGRTLTHSVVNSHMASRLGVFAQPMFEITGDVTNSNLSKLSKIMVAGHNRVGPGLVLRQARWPHEVLQAGVPGYMKVEHEDMTFHQLVNGLFSKVLTEVPMERLDLEMANKLSFYQFLSNMSFVFPHRLVLDAYKEIHNAWQMREFEWTDDWSTIEQKLITIRSRHQQVPQKHTSDKKANFPGFDRNNGNGGGGAGKGGNPKNTQGLNDIQGVPRAYMKAHHICMKFNGPRGCKKAASHKNETNEAETLLHICGGCHKKHGKQLAHPAETCDERPFGALFRGW